LSAIAIPQTEAVLETYEIRSLAALQKRVAFRSLLPFTISGRRSNWRHCRFRFTYSSVRHDITACMKVRPMAGPSDKTSAAGFVKYSQVVQTFLRVRGWTQIYTRIAWWIQNYSAFLLYGVNSAKIRITESQLFKNIRLTHRINVHYRTHKSSTLVFLVSHMNPAHKSTTYKTHMNILTSIHIYLLW